MIKDRIKLINRKWGLWLVHSPLQQDIMNIGPKIPQRPKRFHVLLIKYKGRSTHGLIAVLDSSVFRNKNCTSCL